MKTSLEISSDSPDGQNPGWFKTAFLCLPMMLILFLLLSHGKPPTGSIEGLAVMMTYLFVNGIFFLMIKTGKTDRWRAVLFITYAACFVFSFTTNLIAERGSLAVTSANMIDGEVPFCHMVIPVTLIPAALTRTIIFPGTIVGAQTAVAGMFVLWIGASLALGRGFCSWGCFFGGLEDGFSRLFKKARLRNIDSRWTYLPFAVLLLIVLASAAMLAPFYCEWLCPFKTVTEFAEINSVKSAVQAVIFVSLFFALVVILPALTRRRTQCGLFCPMGAFQSFTNTFNVFEIRVNPDKCIHCRKCITACPTFSMDEGSIVKGKPAITCIKCGKCVDLCGSKAVFYHIKGTPLAESRFEISRRLFIYPAFIFLATMSGGFVQDSLAKTMKLLSGMPIL